MNNVGFKNPYVDGPMHFKPVLTVVLFSNDYPIVEKSTELFILFIIEKGDFKKLSTNFFSLPNLLGIFIRVYLNQADNICCRARSQMLY